MRNLLREIFEHNKKELPSIIAKHPLHELQAKIDQAGPTRNFKSAFTKNKTSIIAEIKYKSPSKKEGFLNKASVDEIAKCYQSGGASAISVLTEEKSFGGNIRHLGQVRQAVNLPILRKDFLFDPYQVYEARAYGADAFLLIADYLARETLETLIEAGRKLGIEPLVEVHSEESVEKVLDLPFSLFGINNRNLVNMTIDENTTTRLIKKYGEKLKDKIVISLSGVETKGAVVKMERQGVSNFLIGTALMNTRNPEEKLKELIGS